MTSIDLPESVHRYCVDARARSAVDLLLAGRGPKVPPTLGWDELADFYRACGAAQRTRIDWGLALVGLWEAVWGGLLDGWRPSTPAEQLRMSGISVSPDALWGGDSLTREHARRGFLSDPYVELDVERGVRAGVGLFKEDEAFVTEVASDWTASEDDDDYVTSDWLPIGASPSLDLTTLRREAQATLRRLNLTVDGRSSSVA